MDGAGNQNMNKVVVKPAAGDGGLVALIALGVEACRTQRHAAKMANSHGSFQRCRVVGRIERRIAERARDFTPVFVTLRMLYCVGGNERFRASHVDVLP
ncbi:hypothetical protein D3C72_1770200 [compost metagenome]